MITYVVKITKERYPLFQTRGGWPWFYRTEDRVNRFAYPVPELRHIFFLLLISLIFFFFFVRRYYLHFHIRLRSARRVFVLHFFEIRMMFISNVRRKFCKNWTKILFVCLLGVNLSRLAVIGPTICFPLSHLEGTFVHFFYVDRIATILSKM